VFSHNTAALTDVTLPDAHDGLVRATFQLVAGLGPTREAALWAAGITDWAQLPTLPAGILPRGLHEKLLPAIAAAEAALAARDLAALAAAWPGREMWRLYGAFPERAVYLDIESDHEDGVSAIGLYDQAGPRILLAGRDLPRFPAEVGRDALLVTFNGGSYDVPNLRRAFPAWQAPPAHIDLRTVYTRLGHWGGLKAIEATHGLARPDHLRGLDGSTATWLWRHAKHGSAEALRRFAEYNLYDTVNLRPLLVQAYNRLAAATDLAIPVLPAFTRGDVLYDVSKILMDLGQRRERPAPGAMR
jgi:uncharacterized protein YprB with RNaseH-like and TPR domain